MKFFWLATSFLLSLFFFTSCEKKSERADLVVINGAEPESLDPAIVTGISDERIVEELFEGLLRFNRKGEVEPGVASSWEISSDQRTYIFHLRPEAKWSDGKNITADDFVASWRRTLQPETGSAYSYQLFIVKGAEDFFSGKEKDFSKVGVKPTFTIGNNDFSQSTRPQNNFSNSLRTALGMPQAFKNHFETKSSQKFITSNCASRFQALDEHTLQVTLSQPTSYFLSLCATSTFFPVRVDLIDRVGDNWIKPEQMICNGPYKLAGWRINDTITLERNPFYWDVANVHLKKIDLLSMDQPNIAYNFYAAGQADLSFAEVPLALIKELQKQSYYHSSILLGTDFIRFNCTKPPFSDARVRKALALCVDQDRIVEKMSYAVPAKSFTPPGLPEYQLTQGMASNPERARELLAEAGYPGGKGFPLTTYLYNESEMTEGVAVELQAAWKKELGISVVLARQEWKVFLSSLKNLDYTMARSSWIGDYPDPNTFLDIFTSGSDNNRTGWKLKRYDSLIQQASSELNPKRRFQIFQEAEKILIDEEVPIVPLFFTTAIQLYDLKRLGGIKGNLLNRHPLREIYKNNP